MSRTIRRKDYIPFWVTHEWKWIARSYLVRVPLEGKALKKAIRKHHSDAGYITYVGSGIGCPKWFRKAEQKKYRVQCRQEIYNTVHLEDYECMIVANPKLPYWD